MYLEHFATQIANITQRNVFNTIEDKIKQQEYSALVSFGYFWQNDTFFRSPYVKNARKIVLHPIMCNVETSLCYEIATEFGVVWLLAYFLLDDKIKAKEISFKSIDIGYLSSETNLSEEELENYIYSLNTSRILLVLGEEIAFHAKSKEIAELIGFVSRNLCIDVCMPNLARNISPQVKYEPKLIVCDELPESNGYFIYAIPSKDNILLQAPAFFSDGCYD